MPSHTYLQPSIHSLSHHLCLPLWEDWTWLCLYLGRDLKTQTDMTSVGQMNRWDPVIGVCVSVVCTFACAFCHTPPLLLFCLLYFSFPSMHAFAAALCLTTPSTSPNLWRHYRCPGPQLYDAGSACNLGWWRNFIFLLLFTHCLPPPMSCHSSLFLILFFLLLQFSHLSGRLPAWLLTFYHHLVPFSYLAGNTSAAPTSCCILYAVTS